MRARAACLSFLFLASLPSLAGCQRLNDERTVTVDAFANKSIKYDAPRYQQKLKVTVRSPGAPVKAYLIRSDDQQALKDVERNKAPASALAGQEKSAEEFFLSATIPAKTAFTLFLDNDGKKTAQVKVKAVGR